MIVQMLQSLDGSSDGSPLAAVFDFKLPVIDRSVSDLVDLSGDFLDFVEELIANPAGSLQKLETRLRTLLGLPAPDELDPSTLHPAVRYHREDPLLQLRVLVVHPDHAPVQPRPGRRRSRRSSVELVGLSASGNLGVQAGIDLDLRLGLDLVGADKAFFIDVDETSLHASASAFGNNLEFEASIGPVGIFVDRRQASLEGDVRRHPAGRRRERFDGRLNLLAFGGSGVSSDLDDLGDFLDIDDIATSSAAPAR